MRTAIVSAFAVAVTASVAWAAPEQCPGFQGDGVPLNDTSVACSASDCSSGVGSALEEIAVQLCSLGVLPVTCGRCACCRRPAIDLFTGTDVSFVGPGNQFCHIGGRGRPMGEAALCLLRDLANTALGSDGPGIQLERKASLAIGDLTVRQHVGFVDFDVPGRRMRGYHSVTFCAPVLGCISNQTQSFTATLQQVDNVPETCRDYLYLNPSVLHVDSEQFEHDVHIGIGPLTVFTPAGPVSVEPSLDYEMNLEAVTAPTFERLGKNRPIGCADSDEFNVGTAPLGVGATLLAGLQDDPGRGWNAALGLGGRDPDPADPIWMPGAMDPSDFPRRPDFDFSIARSLSEKRPTGRFRTAVNVCYGVGDSCDDIITGLLGNLDIPPLSLEAFEVYVRSSLEAAFTSEFAIAIDEGKPNAHPDTCAVPETNLRMQSALDALGKIEVKAGLKIEFVLDLGFYHKAFLFNPEVNVVDFTPVEKSLIPSPEAVARMQVDGPPSSPQAYTSFASFSAGAEDGRKFVDACLKEPPPEAQEMPAPSFEPGNPQDIVGMQEFQCNICLFFPSQITQVCAPKPGVPSDYPCPLAINGMPCTDPNCQNVPVSPPQSVNLKQVLFPVSQSELPPAEQWMCNAFEKFGCFDLCHYDPNSTEPLTITQSAVDKIGPRCRDATGGSDPTFQGAPCDSVAECDDGNPCTVKTCSGPEIKTCSITNSDGPCDDGLFCNGADTCALGICGAHAGNPCSATAECCNEATDTCPASCPGTPCGDKNVGDPCDDGTACSTGDHCVSSIAGPLCRGDLAISCASSTCTAGLCTDIQGQPECVSVPSGACPPGCGNGMLDPDEQCDGAADAACPGKCLPDCSCPPPGSMNGEPCQTAGQCASENCVDGVCCNTSCAGPLEQCNLSGQVGTCATLAAPVPTLSRAAVLVALIALMAVAGFAWRRRARL